MLRFRPPNPDAVPGAVADLLTVGQMIDAAMQPGNFFVAPELHLTWSFARAETIPWEIFRGRLVEPTRLQKTFLSWHVLQDEQPVISVKLDVHERRIYVTRGFLAYVWEGVDAGGGVIESRETMKWTNELVGTIALAEFADLEAVHDELICLLWHAVVGTSRLPLTSVEAPLPSYVFGQFHYLSRHNAAPSPATSHEDFFWSGCMGLGSSEYVKLLEFTLRSGQEADIRKSANSVGHVWMREPRDMMPLLQRLFNDASLSPQTVFAENALAFVSYLQKKRYANEGDFLSWLLRQLARHLTAYDLVTFHHRGANYPDALLLDATLKRYWHFPDDKSNQFLDDHLAARRRRRALRQACLLRRHYEGHRVPDVPTSPGENARVLPAGHPRVPEEQLTQTLKRPRQLFAGDPLPRMLTEPSRAVFEQSVRDLEHLDERVEMGLGVFIDRPLGYAKEIGEPDLTPILAHEAFSPSIARRRWRELKQLCAELGVAVDASELDLLFENGPWPAGLPHTEIADCPRPTAALADVRKAASDFVILRTLPRGLKELLSLFDWQPLLDRFRLHFLATGDVRLCVPTLDENKQPALALYDDRLRRRVEIAVDARAGYFARAGREWPRAGLRVRAVWEDGEELVRCDGLDFVIEAVKP